MSQTISELWVLGETWRIDKWTQILNPSYVSKKNVGDVQPNMLMPIIGFKKIWLLQCCALPTDGEHYFIRLAWRTVCHFHFQSAQSFFLLPYQNTFAHGVRAENKPIQSAEQQHLPDDFLSAFYHRKPSNIFCHYRNIQEVIQLFCLFNRLLSWRHDDIHS